MARQTEFAERWAADNGMVLDTSLSMRDDGLSAYHQKHIRKGALGTFLRAVEDRIVPPGSVLLVESLDRLSRAEPLTALTQLTGIIDSGVAVVTASDSRVYTRERLKADPMQLMHSLLIMLRAHEESETKSKRVRDAIRRQCKGWQAGTYRGLIRYGMSPGWLHVVSGKWTLVPERAQAVRLAIDWALAGVGLGEIARRLHEAGLRTGGVDPTSGHLQRLLAHPALFGRKVLDLNGESFVLDGYYPAVIGQADWDALQIALAGRARGSVRGEIPSVLTGLGVTICGYCGSPLKGQTMASKAKPDGSLSDGHRRLQCTANNSGARCPVPGSCSAAPIERALIHWCSDMLNLRSLHTSGAGAAARSHAAQTRIERDKLDAQAQRITDAMLESAEPPAAFVQRAREIELAMEDAERRLTEADEAVASLGRAMVDGADERWREVAAGVQALDRDARSAARQLVADTFERIVVYRKGVRPGELPPGDMEVMLIAKGGATRLLHIKRDGSWVAQDDWTLPDR